MSEVRRVLLANGQYIEIVQETGTSTGAVMSQNAVTAALSGKANASHNHVAGNITGGTFDSARIADGAVTSGKLATNAVVNAKIANGAVTSGKLSSNSVTTAKILDKAVTKAKLADDVISSLPASSYETVIVTATVSDNQSVNGLAVSINGVQYTFNSTGKVSAMVPQGQVYSVTPISTAAFNASGGGTYTASTGNRTVSVAYTVGYGVYIEDKQGKLYTTGDWSSGNNANANSVVVVTGTKNFRIALTQIASTMQMSSSPTDPWETYLTGTTDSTVAKTDYNGVANTQNIITKCQSATTYAAGWCNAYTFPDGVTKGYLPAAGELYLAYQNKAAITAALAKCGGTALQEQYYWSSTFYGVDGSIRYCWLLDWSDGIVYHYYLNYSGYVRAFGAH